MGHYYLNMDARGDSSWPLWGMAMRMIEAVSVTSRTEISSSQTNNGNDTYRAQPPYFDCILRWVSTAMVQAGVYQSP